MIVSIFWLIFQGPSELMDPKRIKVKTTMCRLKRHGMAHSRHSVNTFVGVDTFVGLLKDLKEARVAAITDVRSTAYSRWRPQFNRDTLRNSLAEHGVAYVFLGTELGGRGTDGSERDEHGRIQYWYIAESAASREGLRRVRRGSERMRLALMCAESEPLDCQEARIACVMPTIPAEDRVVR